MDAYEWWVGLRYTRSGRRKQGNRFISFISLVSMLGIALGVAALIIVLSVMNGFQKEVRERMLSVLAHVEVVGAGGSLPDWQRTAERMQADVRVRGVAPFVEGQAMLIREDSMRGVVVRGVDPELEPHVSEVAHKLRAGSWSNLQAGQFNIVIGAALARILHVQVGDTVSLAAPEGQVTPAGILPRVKMFRIGAIFDAGHYEYDSGMVFVQLDDARRFYRLDAPSGVRARLADMMQAPVVAQEWSQHLPGELWIRDWTSQNRTYFAAVKTEKTMMFIILTLIVAVASFNLVSGLVMAVTDKEGDIAILRTLGASPASIMRIFMIQGALTGLLGIALGCGIGILVSFNIDVIVPAIEQLMGVQFLPKELYVISKMPSDLHWSDVGSITATTIILAFLATLYPSWRAARVNPAEALRYE